MNTNNIRQTLHSLNLNKLSKPTAICLTALFIVSILSVFTSMPVQAATTTPALHTSGTSIVDANGNVVYLRGVGIAGMVPDLVLWGSGGGDNWGVQWNYNPVAVMDQTFSALQSQWHVNMIRVFVYPSWYFRDGIVPSQEDASSSLTTPISTRAYLRTLCQEADKYGIYVDIVPYMLTPSTSSFGKDPYATTNFGWQGLPMTTWDTPAMNFLSAAGYGNNEQGFWQWFWTDMANNLKDYPNAIFEAWNEPGYNGGDTEPHPIRIHELSANNVHRNQINRRNQPGLHAMENGLAAKRLRQHLRMGIRNKQCIPPNKHRLHNTLLLLRTHRPQLILGKRLRNIENPSAISNQRNGR